MDDNKLNKLRKVKYNIKKCCGICFHGKFKDNSNWGTCGTHTYDHKKHGGGEKGKRRDLSINRYGCCDDFDLQDMVMYELDHYKEFYERS